MVGVTIRLPVGSSQAVRPDIKGLSKMPGKSSLYWSFTQAVLNSCTLEGWNLYSSIQSYHCITLWALKGGTAYNYSEDAHCDYYYYYYVCLFFYLLLLQGVAGSRKSIKQRDSFDLQFLRLESQCHISFPSILQWELCHDTTGTHRFMAVSFLQPTFSRTESRRAAVDLPKDSDSLYPVTSLWALALTAPTPVTLTQA